MACVSVTTRTVIFGLGRVEKGWGMGGGGGKERNRERGGRERGVEREGGRKIDG